MRYRKMTLYCAQCARATVHRQSVLSTRLHVLACILTAGLWIPVWIYWRSRDLGAPVCTRCDTKRLAPGRDQPRSL
jgi:hypothetical protein